MRKKNQLNAGLTIKKEKKSVLRTVTDKVHSLFDGAVQVQNRFFIKRVRIGSFF